LKGVREGEGGREGEREGGVEQLEGGTCSTNLHTGTVFSSCILYRSKNSGLPVRSRTVRNAFDRNSVTAVINTGPVSNMGEKWCMVICM